MREPAGYSEARARFLLNVDAFLESLGLDPPPSIAGRSWLLGSAWQTLNALRDLRRAAGQCARRAPWSPWTTRTYGLCRMPAGHVGPCNEDEDDRNWRLHAGRCGPCGRGAEASLCRTGRELLARCAREKTRALRIREAGVEHSTADDDDIPF